MKLKIMLLGTVASLSLIAVQESQARHNGWYVGLEAGANWIDETDALVSFDNYDVEFNEVALFSHSEFSSRVDFDTGWAGFATAGYAFESNWRIEVELGIRQNDFDLAFDEFYLVKESETSTIGGELTEYTAMVNVIYDVPLSERVNLSIGLGMGVDHSTIDVGGIADDSDTNFAYQAIAGLSYEITRRLDLTLTYRYLHVDEPEFSGVIARREAAYMLDDLEKHSVTVGLRYDLYEDEAPFVAAPPAPPPAPAVAPNKQFIVFFGFNKSNLTAEAIGVIKEAAAEAKSQGSASIVVVGHTDTVGSNKYNDALALRRSGAVKAGLVAEGIAAGSITTSGRGESELMVQTGDNAREPQNRRATIDLN
jgi:OmpA-OmpF porin, OOP family